MTDALQSQCDLIRDALLAGEAITPMDALRRWGCFRLGARIWQLKNERAMDIITEWETDGKKRWATYKLAGPLQMRLAV